MRREVGASLRPEDVLEIGARAQERAPELAAAQAEEGRAGADRRDRQHALARAVEVLVARQVEQRVRGDAAISAARARERDPCAIAAPAAACAIVITLPV